MYSIVMVFSMTATADIPDAHRRSRAAAGCTGNVARSSGCQGQPSVEFKYQPPPVIVYVVPEQSASCHGTTYGAPKASGCFGGEGRGFAPLRNFAAAVADNLRDRVDNRQQTRAARHGGETTYFVAAVPVTTAAISPPQTKMPPVAKP